MVARLKHGIAFCFDENSVDMVDDAVRCSVLVSSGVTVHSKDEIVHASTSLIR